MGTLGVQMQPFFEWLVRSTCQAGLIVCLILLLQTVFRNRLGVRWHHALWLILVIRMVLPWAPQSRWSVFNVVAGWDQPHASHSSRIEPSDPPPATSSTESLANQSTGSGAATNPDGQPKNIDRTPKGSQKSDGSAMSPPRRTRDVLPLVWLMGALALGAYVVVSNARLWRATSIEHPSTDKDVLELLEECRARMGLRTIVALVTSEKVNTPVLLGFIRPRLLIPKDIARQLSHEELRYVFLHELAHVKRHDIALAWLTALLQVLHWFNPLVWLAFHRMRADRELACDALVLTRTQGEGTKDYGRAIVSLLERFSFPPPLPGLAGILENKSQLKRRIAMITQFKNNSYRWSVAGIGIITVLGAISMIDPTRGAVSASPGPETKAPMTMRLVQKQTTGYASLSPDGRYLCDCDPAHIEGIITMRELASGVQRTVKPTKRTPEEQNPQYPVLSPDNKTIAYVAWHGPEMGWPDRGDVCLIGADSLGQRVLCSALRLIQWFPDGSRILGIRLPQGSFKEEIEIVSVSITDGSVQVIKTLTGQIFGTNIRLSPDAKYIAYELRAKDAPAKRDIFAFEIDSKRETLLVGHPADDKLLDWIPDGRHMLFLSDRTEPWSAWLVPVVKGQVQGTPEQVARNMSDVAPIGFAGNGSYYYRLVYGFGNVYTAAINVTTGQPLSAPAPLETAGYNHGVAWSPDGKYLAYCSEPATAPAGAPGVIRIRSLATGEERELVHKVPTYFRRIRWSPDGRSLLAFGLLAFERDKVVWMRRVCRIDVDTGENAILLDTQKINVSFAELSPDGKILYYSGGSIVRRQLDTGQEKEIFTGRGGQAGWALSPDGQFIAAGCNEGTENSAWEGGVKKVLLIPAQGGQATELVRWDEPAGVLTNFAWSRDSKTVLFLLHREFVARGDTQLPQITEFWQVPRDGGQPRKITEADLGICFDLRVHPDGQRIGFFAAGQRQELWVMENFLPAGTEAKESK